MSDFQTERTKSDSTSSNQKIDRNQISFREALREAFIQEMDRDPDIIQLGEDLAGGGNLPHLEGDESLGGSFGVTANLSKRFGRKRIIDTPISETAYVGAACGAAILGLRPIIEIQFMSFFGVCFDQIFNQIARSRYLSGGENNVPVVIRGAGGAGWGGAGQHSDIAYSHMTHIAGLKVVVPSTPYDCKGLMISAIRDDDPVFFMEHIKLYDSKGYVPEESYSIPIGKADIKREGNHVTIVATSYMVNNAIVAANSLIKDGIDVEILDPRTLSPLDESSIISSIQKTRKLVVVDEDNPRCGFAADVSALAADKCFDYLEAPIKLVTCPHVPCPFSPQLEAVYVPSPEKIIDTVKNII